MRLGSWTREIFHKGPSTLDGPPSIYRMENGVRFSPSFRLPPANGITDPYLNELGVVETAKSVTGNPRKAGTVQLFKPNHGTYLPSE